MFNLEQHKSVNLKGVSLIYEVILVLFEVKLRDTAIVKGVPKVVAQIVTGDIVTADF